MHSEYEYVLWTDEKSRDFIKDNYEWFLPTFDSYPYPIMRADVIRYFVLSTYGGIYIDLDNGCDMKLDPLLAFPAFLRRTQPTGISNDIMGAVPHHPFFDKVINNLARYNRNWFVSYVTIMYSTGPLFLSVMWKQYTRWGVPEDSVIRILFPNDEKLHKIYFFFVTEGSSWHLGDAKFIMQMGQHWMVFTILGTGLFFFTMYGQFKFYQMLTSGALVRFFRRFVRRLHHKKDVQYEMLSPDENV